MIRLPGWKPPVISSRSLKPDGVPVSGVLSVESRWSLSVSSSRISAIGRNFFWRSSWATSSTERSARSTQVARRRLARQDAGLDLVGRRQQRAQLGVVAHDLPVLARVAGGRHPPGELVDRRRAADLLELAALAQRLGHRQVVDLAVVLVQLDHRREHRAVLLAVEVLGPQVLLDEQPWRWRSSSSTAPSTDFSASRLCGGTAMVWTALMLESESRFRRGRHRSESFPHPARTSVTRSERLGATGADVRRPAGRAAASCRRRPPSS